MRLTDPHSTDRPGSPPSHRGGAPTGIGPVQVIDRVTMQLFVADFCGMVAASVQRDVDGIAKGSHYVFLKRERPGLSNPLGVTEYRQEPECGADPVQRLVRRPGWHAVIRALSIRASARREDAQPGPTEGRAFCEAL